MTTESLPRTSPEYQKHDAHLALKGKVWESARALDARESHALKGVVCEDSRHHAQRSLDAHDDLIRTCARHARVHRAMAYGLLAASAFAAIVTIGIGTAAYAEAEALKSAPPGYQTSWQKRVDLATTSTLIANALLTTAGIHYHGRKRAEILKQQKILEMLV